MCVHVQEIYWFNACVCVCVFQTEEEAIVEELVTEEPVVEVSPDVHPVWDYTDHGFLEKSLKVSSEMMQTKGLKKMLNY